MVKIDALATPLTNTYWKLVEIEDSEVRFRAGYRESHMRMLASTDRFTGQGICNRVGGGYQLEGNKLSFNPSDNMPSPCWPDGPPESALTDALRSTVSFELVDKDLFLIDEDGVRRAHYLAVPRPGERREVGK